MSSGCSQTLQAWPLASAQHMAANTSFPQICSISTIPLGDGWVLLEHGVGRAIFVVVPQWPSNSSKAVDGLLGEGFGSVVTGRLLSLSGGGKVGDKARKEEVAASAWEAALLWGSSSTTEGVGCKILPTWTSSPHMWKTHCDSSVSLQLRAGHSSPSKR